MREGFPSKHPGESPNSQEIIDPDNIPDLSGELKSEDDDLLDVTEDLPFYEEKDYDRSDYDPIKKLREDAEKRKISLLRDKETGKLLNEPEEIQKSIDQELVKEEQLVEDLLWGREWSKLERMGVDAKFFVLKTIRTGGLGVIYIVWNAKKEKLQAIKAIRNVDNSTRKNFEKEKYVMAGLKSSKHLVGISDEIDLGKGETGLVMDYVPGQNLDNFLEEHQVFEDMKDLDIVSLKIVGGFAFALRDLHDVDISHNDLKPGNVMLKDNQDGTTTPVVIDYGLAKVEEVSDVLKMMENDGNQYLGKEGAENLSVLSGQIAERQKDKIVGTPLYVAPEVIQNGFGGVVDLKRADYNALGTIIYKILTGRNPVEGTDAREVMIKRVDVNTEIKQPSDVIKDTGRVKKNKKNESPALEDLAKNLMSLKPEDRIGSIQLILEIMYGAFLDHHQNLQYAGLNNEIKDVIRPYHNRPEVIDNPREYLINKYREWIDGRAVSGNFAPVQALNAEQYGKQQNPAGKRVAA